MREVQGSSPIRVLVLRDHLKTSGGTIYFEDVLPRLDPTRVVAQLAVLSASADEVRRFEDLGIDLTQTAHKGLDPRRFLSLLRTIRSFQADLIHISGSKAMLAGIIAARLTGIPATVFFNNAIEEPPARLMLQRRLSSAIAGGVAASVATRDWACAHYGVPQDRIEVIYGGRNLDAFLDMSPDDAASSRSRIRSELGMPQTAKVIGLVGRVDAAQKGHFGLLEVVRDLLPKYRNLHLMIVGDGPDLAACRSMASDLGIAERVRFTGNRSDIPAMLSAVDLAAVPSLCDEAYGFSAIEAQAAGCPVVAFRSGGLAEAISEGKSGRLARTGDWKAFTNLCDELLANPSDRLRLGQCGRSLVRGVSVDAHVKALTAFFMTHARQSTAPH